MNQILHDAMQRSLSAFMFLLILLRLYVRAYHNRKFGFSDVFVILAWILYTVPVIIDWCGPYKHDQESEKAAIWWGKWVYYWQAGYFTIYYSIKASVLLFYNEWIPRILNRWWIANRCLMAFTAICYIYTASITLLRCQPISSNWALDEKEFCCAACHYPTYLSKVTLHLFTDFLIVLLPLCVLRQMENLPIRQKLAAGFMFALGLLSIVTSILVMLTPKFARGDDTNIFIVQNIDQSAGIVVACCPAFKVFLSTNVRAWFGKGEVNSANSGSNGSWRRSINFKGSGNGSRNSMFAMNDVGRTRYGTESAVHLYPDLWSPTLLRADDAESQNQHRKVQEDIRIRENFTGEHREHNQSRREQRLSPANFI